MRDVPAFQRCEIRSALGFAAANPGTSLRRIGERVIAFWGPNSFLLRSVAWETYPGVEIALLAYDYEQRHASDELRDVSIELDTNGVDRDLGHENDLVLTVEAFGGVELTLVVAEFEAGAAYGDREGEHSRFVSFELEYSF